MGIKTSNDHYANKNARNDGFWDAEHNLGNNNQYNTHSASWYEYENAYSEVIARKAKHIKLANDVVKGE
jgi:hypothetical protein